MLVKDKAPEQRYGQCQIMAGELIGSFNFFEDQSHGFLNITGSLTRQIYTSLLSRTTFLGSAASSYQLTISTFAAKD